MTRLRRLQIAHVAVWEFRRFFKLRDQMLSLALAVVGGALGFSVQHFVGRATGPVTVAVVGQQKLPGFHVSPTSRIVLKPFDSGQESRLREAIGRHEIDALLVIDGVDRAELFVSREPVWENELRSALTEARSRAKLKDADIDPDKLLELIGPMPVEVVYHPAGRGATSSAEKLVAAALVGLTCLGVFLGLASFFGGITGEKALRVTEQVIAAITPQTWVDGKLLGLTAAALGTLLTYALALVVFLGILRLGVVFTVPWSALRPVNFALYLLFAMLGILLWNCVFAAIAVTINDPNSSTRSSLMFLPMMFVAMGFPGLQAPDSAIMRALSVLPGTSPTVMTARLVLSEVPAWEVMIAIGLMALAILFFRRVAGKVFAANILLTGKELSWRELWQGIRHA